MSKLDSKDFLKIETDLNRYWDGEYIDVDLANRIASYCDSLVSKLKNADGIIQAISHTYSGEGTDIQVSRKMANLANSYLNDVKSK